jgi:acyl-CoA thioesterase
MAQPLFPLFENSPYTKLTGVEFTKREDGYSQAVLKVTESVLRITNGSVHGGAIATLVDVGMGAALLTHLKDDELAATIELHIYYLATALSGVLICESKFIHKGKKIATLESEVINEGRLVAKATATFSIYKVKGN